MELIPAVGRDSVGDFCQPASLSVVAWRHGHVNRESPVDPAGIVTLPVFVVVLRCQQEAGGSLMGISLSPRPGSTDHVVKILTCFSKC